MDKAVEKKMDNYAARLRGLGIDFNAFAMDIFGGMGKSCQTIVSRLAVG
jgi:hypothetical protein